MYSTHKTYIRPQMKMAGLINENHALLLLMEHLEIDFNVRDLTVEELCRENRISTEVFVAIGNLYNGFLPEKIEQIPESGIPVIISYLKNSHSYYKKDKYPELIELLHLLKKNHHSEDIGLIEKFFNDYFEEVLEHLDYEEEIAFPYFCRLLNLNNDALRSDFSVDNYKEHHTDIETKLTDLKNLLLKHIQISNDLTLRRKFFNSLFELEFDLTIHSIVEEDILLPLIKQVETKLLNG
ncbi:MAG: hemerythrin domain-containing protein [Bacteroidales bacterium]|nr:hemerythrin domain-containing protein [Bacteroidales bacterium]